MGLGQTRSSTCRNVIRILSMPFREELGFIGAALVLLLSCFSGGFSSLTIQDSFGSLLAVGVTCMIIVRW